MTRPTGNSTLLPLDRWIGEAAGAGVAPSVGAGSKELAGVTPGSKELAGEAAGKSLTSDPLKRDAEPESAAVPARAGVPKAGDAEALAAAAAAARMAAAWMALC